jgi:hypothetical protein
VEEICDAKRGRGRRRGSTRRRISSHTWWSSTVTWSGMKIFNFFWCYIKSKFFGARSSEFSEHPPEEASKFAGLF